jgi:hypothetical protein
VFRIEAFFEEVARDIYEARTEKADFTNKVMFLRLS